MKQIIRFLTLCGYVVLMTFIVVLAGFNFWAIEWAPLLRNLIRLGATVFDTYIVLMLIDAARDHDTIIKD